MMNRGIARWIIISLLLLCTACTSAAPASQEQAGVPSPGSSSPEPDPISHLRIFNVGEEDIQNLVVLFPSQRPSETVRIRFPDVPAGEMTEYQPIPTGVYRYAAYEYTVGGRTVHQPVTDFMGEQTLPGTHFTYQLRLDTTRLEGDQLQLVIVMDDSDSQ